MVLSTGCFVQWIVFLTDYKIDPRLWTDCGLFYFLFDFGKHYSSMLLVLMSAEKCFAVYFPLKAKTFCTVRTAKWATGIVGIVFAGYDSINFYVMESGFYNYTGTYDCFYISVNYHIYLIALDSVLYSSGPFTLIFIINLAIIFKFMAAKFKNDSLESTNQALAKSATRGTAMVVTVSVTFLLLTAPTAVHNSTFRWYSLAHTFPLYRALMDLTQYLNHSINGILYCIVGSRFRDEILKAIRPSPKARPESSSSMNNTRPRT